MLSLCCKTLEFVLFDLESFCSTITLQPQIIFSHPFHSKTSNLVFTLRTGEWKHLFSSLTSGFGPITLKDVSFTKGTWSLTPYPDPHDSEHIPSSNECLEIAKKAFDSAKKIASKSKINEPVFPNSVAKLKWFLTPREAQSCLLGQPLMPVELPIQPLSTQPLMSQPYPGSLSGILLEKTFPIWVGSKKNLETINPKSFGA